MSDVQLTVVEGDVAQVIGAIPGPQGPAGAVAAAIDGSAALPSIAFASDTDTGLYRVGANQLGVSTGGTQRLVIDSNGQIEATSLGTAAAPTWTFVGDPNTGIYSPGADQLALATNGSGRLLIDSFGSVRLPDGGLYGKADNTGALGVYGGGAFNQGAGGLFYSSSHPTNPNLIQFVNGAFVERARIRSDGMFEVKGAGTAGASPAFSVSGSAPANSAIVDSSGRLLVGTSTSRAASGLAALSQVETTGYGALSLVQNSADAGGCVVTIGKTRSATIGGSTVVQNGDNLATIYFNGADGSGLSSIGASITAFVDGTPAYAATALVNGQTYRIVTVGTTNFTLIGASANTVGTVFTATGPGTGTGTAILNAGNMPGRIVLSTTADGASSPTERMRITSAGVLQIADAGNIAVGTTTGTKIGTATTQKLGFFNKTPVVQPAAVADATDAASVITQLNALLARMRDLGLIAT